MPKKKGLPANGDRLWRITDVCEYLGISRRTLYRLLQRDPTFPRPSRTFGHNEWSERAVKAWRRT